MEQWLPAYGFEQTHEVSNQGRVRSRNKVLAQRLRPDGYLDTCLRAAGKTHTKTIHRLVAMAFVPGDNALTINHKDGIKTNNAEDNLEWVTPLENIRHACNTGLRAALTDAKRAELYAAGPSDEVRHSPPEHSAAAKGATTIPTEESGSGTWDEGYVRQSRLPLRAL
jgi:hypothetical protein